MAPTLSEFLKFSKTEKERLKKEELLTILESTQSNDNGNDMQTLITSLTNLTAQIGVLTQAFSDHQELTRSQFAEFKQQMAKQNEIIA